MSGGIVTDQVAILFDGGFVKKRLMIRLHHFPAKEDVVALSQTIMGHERLKEARLFRVFFYDAPPFEGKSRNPLDRSEMNFSTTLASKQNKSLLDSLELEPDFAVRRGQIAMHGWKLGQKALQSLKKGPRNITPKDLVPDLEQKGVDLRMGLDIATIALKRVIGTLVLVTGDSDLVPAMKLARTEGLKIYVEALGNPIRRELRAHADLVL
jgi:uncharacterized LabA/DUF88 family protein